MNKTIIWLTSLFILVFGVESFFGQTLAEEAKKHFDLGVKLENKFYKDAEVNAVDKDGQTPLHYAAEGGCKEIVQLLIAKGADINAKDNQGKTPPDWLNIIIERASSNPEEKWTSF